MTKTKDLLLNNIELRDENSGKHTIEISKFKSMLGEGVVIKELDNEGELLRYISFNPSSRGSELCISESYSLYYDNTDIFVSKERMEQLEKDSDDLKKILQVEKIKQRFEEED